MLELEVIARQVFARAIVIALAEAFQHSLHHHLHLSLFPRYHYPLLQDRKANFRQFDPLLQVPSFQVKVLFIAKLEI